MGCEWGPLAALAGEWVGEGGLDTSFSHAVGDLTCTPYTERATLEPFGPVRNGRQQLFGLDYRSAMCRLGDTAPFHQEAGYWLWDADAGEVLRAVVVPRGVTVLATGPAAADADGFSLAADLDGSATIAESRYLAERASSLSYRATVTVEGDGAWRYEATTMLRMAERPEPLAHTDSNTLHRIG